MATLVLVWGCSAFQIQSEITAGRKALLDGQPETALTHFQHVSDLNKDYAGWPFAQGIMTYAGRAYYNAGKLPEAGIALEQSLARNGQDLLAHLYLGLVFARNGDRERGGKEIRTGLQGLHESIDFLVYNTSSGRFWDPGRRIRSGIEYNIALLSAPVIDWKSVITNVEYLGKNVETEVDRAVRREQASDQRQGDADM
jgi:hypothetical protein